ncbi:MAG: hypothetical protein ACXWC9_08520 [Pseudobdellovibrionaceae bacterium]
MKKEFNLAFTFDENLQEVPVAPDQMAFYIKVKTNELKLTKDANMQVKLMGEIGVFLRNNQKYPQNNR